jgi:hypothetical protein
MNMQTHSGWLRFTALLCTALLVPGDVPLLSQEQNSPQAAAEAPALLPADQLDSLVAPIALYPDPLLAQVLAASTYPLEIVQLQQWLAKHKDLKDKALVDAVQREGWDPSVQAMAALPDVVKQLSENIKWTAELGNAFLAQQADVMDAVQRMRMKAKNAGNLKSNKEMKVETQVVESKTVVVIEQASPEVVYVPSYNPTVVYGPPVYPYPPISDPPPGYYAAGMAISFGVGVAVGAAFGGGWGWGCGWGNNNVNVNVNNNFINNYNRQNVNNKIGSGNNNWQHNPQHRGGAPYGDRATASKYGGTARGESVGSRQARAQGQGGPGGSRQQPGVSNRAAGGAGNLGGSRGAAGGASTAGANRASGGGDRIGNQQVSGGGGSRSSGAFSGAGRNSGSQARSNSQRGASSMGGSRGARTGGGRRR